MARAEYMREYRAQRKASGDPLPRGAKTKPWQHGASGKRLTKFARAHFIAWDGEGITTNERIDDSTFRHNFVLFSNSTGDNLRLQYGKSYISTIDCFSFLLSTSNKYPHAIHVVYGGSYDMNHILRDLPRRNATEIAETGETFWNGYYIQFHPRRSLLIKRGDQSITLWDVIGFFQMSFERAVKEWLGDDYEEKEIISEGKKRRTIFQIGDMDFMQKYNDAELRALVLLMQRFHTSVSSLNLTLSRWDGAGSIASAILKKESFKQHFGETPKIVEEAARHAYFGGRFELGQYGIYEGKCYGYDINSAYPSVFRSMPSLANGHWQRLSASDPDIHRCITPFSLVRVRWELRGIRFGPFSYRNSLGLVSYPESGENWVWGVEYLAWLNTIPDHPSWTVEILDVLTFQNTSKISVQTHGLMNTEMPFYWIQRYYDTRQAIVNGKSSLPYGCQMVLKLGLNSLYGKTAQSLGYNEETGRTPPFHNLLYAGFITASTRARLWEAAMQAPDSIVMMATDGIISTTPLNLEISTEKKLGAWEYTEYDLVACIQSGVYITRQGEKWSFRKRGIDSDGEAEVFLTKVDKHWSNPDTAYQKMPVSQSRMIGIKSAVRSDDMWKRWGCWYNYDHELLVHPGPDTKRMVDESSRNLKPSNGFVHTVPSFNVLYEFQNVFSEPYRRPWDSIRKRNWNWSDDEELAELQDNEFS